MSRLKTCSSALQSQKWQLMRPSIARYGEQLDPRYSTQTYHRAVSALGLLVSITFIFNKKNLRWARDFSATCNRRNVRKLPAGWCLAATTDGVVGGRINRAPRRTDGRRTAEIKYQLPATIFSSCCCVQQLLLRRRQKSADQRRVSCGAEWLSDDQPWPPNIAVCDWPRSLPQLPATTAAPVRSATACVREVSSSNLFAESDRRFPTAVRASNGV